MAKKRAKHIIKAISKHHRVKKAVKKPNIKPKEHVKNISYDYEGRRKRLEVYDLPKKEREKFTRPLGIKVLTAYLGVILFFYLTYLIIGAKIPMAVIFGQIISGWQALVITSILTAVILLTIYSITKRKKWGYYLSLIWFIFGMLNSIISLALLKSEIVTVTRDFLILSAAAVFLINIIAIVYIASEKQYFFAQQFLLKRPRVIDKVFVALITIFIASVLVIGGVLGYDFYRTNIKTTDLLISELENKTEMQQDDICSSKKDQEKDLCLLMHNAFSAVPAHNAVVNDVGLPPVQCVACGLLKGRAVVRMDKTHEGFQSRLKLLTRYSENAMDFVGPGQFTGLQIQIPVPHVGYVLRFGKPCLAFSQRLFHLLACQCTHDCVPHQLQQAVILGGPSLFSV